MVVLAFIIAFILLVLILVELMFIRKALDKQNDRIVHYIESLSIDLKNRAERKEK
jgi:hypothetical protein